ncbi:FAD:protein FMN transferase [Bacillaceae bacterium Marseille-Q3522]|nr:FAD:protein FMN transferase [Bacillaceae bacterium Marseille-Q3522]
MEIFKSRAMNTDVLTSGLSAADAEEVFQWFKFMEEKFSRFLPASELSFVNRMAGQETKISELFARLFYESLKYVDETGGIFTPFLGQVLEKSGYRQSFEKINQVNAEAYDQPVSPSPANFPILFDLNHRIVKINTANLLDFGGIAKGWSVQEIAESLIKRGRKKGLIDAGGDLVSWQTTGEPWLIGVAHPFSDKNHIAKLWLKDRTCAATSSIVKRSWKQNGQIMHHIIDPRTGRPAQSDCLQVTVIGKTLLPCEIYAKCFIIISCKNGSDWLASHRPDLAFIFINKQGRVAASANLNQFCNKAVLIEQITLPADERSISLWNKNTND